MMIKLLYWKVFYSAMIILLLYSLLVFLRCDPLGIEFQLYCSGIDSFSAFYAENIRGHLFAGFLALGGFLMSLKTFIVVSMKENVYDNENYKKTLEKQ